MSGGAHVQELPLVPDRLLDANQRAKGADQVEQGGGNEVRQRGRELVTAAHEVVPHLVRTEDQEQRDRKGEPVGEPALAQPSSLVRKGTPSGRRRRHEGRCEKRQVKERMLWKTKSPS